VIWLGDLNVVHATYDIPNAKKNRNKVPGFTDAERESFGSLVGGDGLGLDAGGVRPGPAGPQPFLEAHQELHPGQRLPTFWSFLAGGAGARDPEKGWRLDYVVLSRALRPRLLAAWARPEVKGSDHCPMGAEFERALVAGDAPASGELEVAGAGGAGGAAAAPDASGGILKFLTSGGGGGAKKKAKAGKAAAVGDAAAAAGGSNE
jgi:hypothetical protein